MKNSMVFLIYFTYLFGPLKAHDYPKKQLTSCEEEELISCYKSPLFLKNETEWEEIQKYHTQKQISFSQHLQTADAVCPLSVALTSKMFYVALKLITEKKVNVAYKDSVLGFTPLHQLIYHALYFDIKEAKINLDETNIEVFNRLVEKGVDINQLSHGGVSALGLFLSRVDNGNQLNLFIKNGAHLYIKSHKHHWNFINSYTHLLKVNYILPESWQLEHMIKHVLYTKCAYDYNHHCSAFMRVKLLNNWYRKKQKVYLPSVLVHYITQYIAPYPFEHIEHTLIDALTFKKEQTSELTKDHYLNNFSLHYSINNNPHAYKDYIDTLYKDFITHTTVGNWRHAWRDFKLNTKDKNNLIVKALHYNPHID